MSKQVNKGVSKGLGKGFGSLLPQDFDQSILLDKHDRTQKVPLEDIQPDPTQPRRNFDEALLGELAQSIKQYGVLQPIVVTEKNGKYIIVAGERRFRAARLAGLERMPVIVRSLAELERLEISLVENVQRVDLNPLEQAVSIVRLHEQFNMEYQEIAQRLGKAYSTIVNIVRLLQLPEFGRQALREGTISEGHARAMLSLKTKPLQKTLLRNIEHANWSVRRAEQFVSENKIASEHKSEPTSMRKPEADQKLSHALSTKLGCDVGVVHKMRGGRIVMDFANRQQFDEFIAWLKTK